MKHIINPDFDGKRSPSEIIAEVLKKILGHQGLYLLDFATGGGKTYNIFELSTREAWEHYQKIVYLVPQVKQRNNGYAEFKAAAKRNGIDPSQCLILESSVHHLERVVDNKVLDDLEKELNSLSDKYQTQEGFNQHLEKTLDELSELRCSLAQNRECKDRKMSLPKSLSDDEMQKKFNVLSHHLRKLLYGISDLHLKHDATTQEELKENIDQCISVLPSLYNLFPWLHIYDAKVILLTAAKYMYPLKMLVNPEIVLYNNPLFNNSLVIFDESDAVYVEIRNAQLEMMSNSLLNVYTTLYDVRTQFAGITGRISHSNRYHQELEEIVTWSLTEIDKLLEGTGLAAYPQLVMNGQADTSRHMIFSTNEHSSILPSNTRHVTIHSDHDSSHQVVNVVPPASEDSEETESSEPKLYVFCIQIIHLLRTIARKLSQIIELDYRKKTRQSTKETATTNIRYTGHEESVAHILQAVHILPGNTTLYRTITQLGNLYRNMREIKAFEDDLSFYSSGWMMMLLQGTDTSDSGIEKHCDCHFYHQNQTPEKLLLHQVLNMNNTVLLLSATATIESLSTNFNISYLKQMSGEKYYSLPSETIERFHQALVDSLPSPEEWSISCDVLPSALPGKPEKDIITGEATYPFVQDLFPLKAKDAGVHFFDLLHKKMQNLRPSGKENTIQFAILRYYKFFHVYSRFVADNSLRSGLVFISAKAKEGLSDYESFAWNRRVLSWGCALIDGRVDSFSDFDSEIGTPAKDNPVRFIFSDNFDEELAEVREDWSNGKKRLIVTTYQTTGAGMNLDYAVPQDLQTVGRLPSYLASNPDYKPRKDIDMVALFDVTCYRTFHRGPSVRNVSQLERSIYITHLLALQYNALMSYTRTRTEIQYLLSHNGSQLNNQATEFAYDQRQYMLQKVKQAIGRISRTTLKNTRTFIWYDESLAECIAKSSETGSYTLEFMALKRHITQSAQAKELKLWETHETRHRHELLVNSSNNIKNNYNSVLNIALSMYHEMDGEVDPRTALAQRHLGEIHEQLLRQPCANEGLPSRYEKLYIRFNQPTDGYYVIYQPNADSLVQEITLPYKDKALPVTMDTVYLSPLMKNHIVKEWFVNHGYATVISSSTYLLQPYLMLSVYKGLIGEQAFAAIIQHYFGLVCRHPDKLMYEVGDWIIEGVHIIWDTKNYRPEHPDHYCERDIQHNIQHKRQKSGMSVVYVNMLTTADKPVITQKEHVHTLGGIIKADTGAVIPEALHHLRRLIMDHQEIKTENDERIEKKEQ